MSLQVAFTNDNSIISIIIVKLPTSWVFSILEKNFTAHSYGKPDDDVIHLANWHMSLMSVKKALISALLSYT
jgi:hypothetical protein